MAEKNAKPEALEDENVKQEAEANVGLTTEEEDGTSSGSIDAEEASRIGTARAERAERSAVTSYFKQQGLTEQEAQEAFEQYKAQKEEQRLAERNDLTAMQARVDQLEAMESERLREANLRLIRAEAMVQAIGLGVDRTKIDYAIRLADLSQAQVNEQGLVDGAQIKEAIERVLTDIPELGRRVDEERTGFKVGAPGSSGTSNELDKKIDDIFGVNDD